jgi:hypothetical protein
MWLSYFLGIFLLIMGSFPILFFLADHPHGDDFNLNFLLIIYTGGIVFGMLPALYYFLFVSFEKFYTRPVRQLKPTFHSMLAVGLLAATSFWWKQFLTPHILNFVVSAIGALFIWRIQSRSATGLCNA